MNGERARPAWKSFRQALADAGFRPSRRLGQNFMLDENMLQSIVRDSGVGAGDNVLEVGAGCGFLTLHLVRAGARVTSVEIDERLLRIARDLVGAEGAVRWIHADVLAGKHELGPEVLAALPQSEPWHVVSNLAYSISAPFLALIADLEHPPASVTVLIQKEVARRITAAPGDDAWGPLSARLCMTYAARAIRGVPAQLFWPRPKVDSAVVRLERLPARLDTETRRRVDRLVHWLFQHRRQAVGRAVSDRLGDSARARACLSSLGIDPLARGEDLDLATLVALANAVAPSAPDEEHHERGGRPE